MFDNEKQENLANARRKLKKFRDQQKQNGSELTNVSSTPNGNNGASTNFYDEQQAILNGLQQNLSKSPIDNLEEQNRQYELLLESQKQQRSRLEDQRQFGTGSSISGRSSQTHSDVDFARQIDQKYRRDLDHLQEQLDIHVQTIGILVAEKTDLTAKLTQTTKQLERKQGEIDVIQGRLKESRERLEDLERQTQNSTLNAQKRDLAAKESDKELDRLRIENNRLNQTIDNLRENLVEFEQKYHQRQTFIDQLNGELTKTKQKLEQSEIRLQQFQSIDENSLGENFNKILQSKQHEIDALLANFNQIRSENEQMQNQHQQYNSNVQRHIAELNEKLKESAEKNLQLVNEIETMKKTFETTLVESVNDQNSIAKHLQNERDTFEQENKLFRDAIDQWATQYEVLRTENHQLNTQIAERDEHIELLEEQIVKLRENSTDHGKLLDSMHEDKTTLSRAMAQNKTLKEQLIELQDKLITMSNDNAKLTNEIQAKEHLNKQLNVRLIEEEKDESSFEQRLDELTKENQSLRERLTQIEEEQKEKKSVQSTSLNSTETPEEENGQVQNAFVQKIIDRFNRAMRDNADLQDRTQQLEHLILQLQSETETIGDYISLYQQQRQQLHRRYQEKDDYIKQLTQDRLNLQRKLSELETLLLRGLTKSTNESTVESTITESEKLADENEWPEMIDQVLTSSSTSEPTTGNSISTALNNFDDETKNRILNLLKELGENNSTAQADHLPTAKLAFIGKNLYVCSTCSGPVQWV